MIQDTYFLEKRYIEMLSSYVGSFSKKGGGLYNFRCNICGDSKLNKRKKRAYIYFKSDNRFRFKCHNCDNSMLFVTYLKKYFPELYKNYLFDLVGEDNNGRLSDTSDTDNTSINNNVLIDSLFDRLDKLNIEHEAVQYVKSRYIDEKYLSEIYYLDDTSKLSNISDSYKKIGYYNEPRIIFPVYTKQGVFVGVFCRDIKGESKIKYISLHIKKEEDMIYGMHRVDISNIVYVVEGQIDSLMLDNAVASRRYVYN